MEFQFATCDRHRALEFLKQLYPSRNIEDEGLTKSVLDLVEKDVIRIPDPSVHGKQVAICPSNNYSTVNPEDVRAALLAFHNAA